MANTITISVTPQDLQDLEKNPSWSATKIFRSAMRLQRCREEFLDIYDIYDYLLEVRKREDVIAFLQKEIQRRNERIDSMQDVLAQKELSERRLRKVEQTNNRFEDGNREIESGVQFGSAAPEIIKGISQ
jgi:hypothetical protein